MSITSEQIRASHQACRRLTRSSGLNFPAAFALLPAAKCQAMHALYAFMRHSDDLADDPQDSDPQEAVARWRAAFEAALQGETTSDLGDDCLLAGDVRGRAILPAVVETVRKFDIPPETLLAVLDGIEMDLKPRIYETFDELAIYCERVASAVGLACMYIWGFDSDAALAPGRSAGIALQLTNILRDLGEDAARGRVYLPQEDLCACGYTADELRRGAVNDAFLRLMKLEIERADCFYREAAELPRWLHKDGRRIYGLMMDRYHALLDNIRKRPGDVFLKRIRLSSWHKLRLAVKWMFLPIWSAAIYRRFPFSKSSAPNQAVAVESGDKSPHSK